MDRLIETINAYTPLTQDEVRLLSNAAHKRVCKKREVFFTEGKISNEIYFVEKGCVRLFYPVDGQEKTAFFYTPGQFICAGESYTYHIPAVENYQAVDDTEIWVFTRSKTEELLRTVPKMEIIGRIATENELITCQKVIASFVPQQYIASFLGVSAETLSRIKRRVHKKRVFLDDRQEKTSG